MPAVQQRRMLCLFRGHLVWLGALCLPLLSGCSMLPSDKAEPRADVPVRYGQDVNKQILLLPPKKPQAPATTSSANLTTASLVGQTMNEVERALGRPESVRDEKPAVVYRYQATGCELKLIFFMDIERQQFRVLSYDIAATKAESRELQACLNEIAAVKAPL